MPSMDGAAVLYQLDKERQTVPDSGVRLKAVPGVVRAIALDVFVERHRVILIFRLPKQKISSVNEIKHFTQLNRAFEWKVYSHDMLLDSRLQLRQRGFRIGEEESLMVRELRDLPPALMASAAPKIAVLPVRDEQDIAHFLFHPNSCLVLRTRQDPWTASLDA